MHKESPYVLVTAISLNVEREIVEKVAEKLAGIVADLDREAASEELRDEELSREASSETEGGGSIFGTDGLHLRLTALLVRDTKVGSVEGTRLERETGT